MPRIAFAITLLFAWTNLAAAQDHGRVLSCALDVYPHKLKDTTDLADTKNYVFRGKVISLGKDKKASICYDVENMRVAGAWVGKPVTWTADKNMGPTVDGEMLFSTKPGPGWAKDGKWDDPRVGKEGPLPRDWAHYKGLYVHGDKVVLSYTVGDMDVLEMPGVMDNGELITITRTFRLGSSSKPHQMLIYERSPGLPDYKSGEPIEWSLSVGGSGLVHARDSEGRKLIRSTGKKLILDIPAMSKGGTLVVSQSSVDANLKYSTLYKRMMDLSMADIADISSFTKGGAAHWPDTLETTATLGDNKIGPYTLDAIALPEKNPWGASIRFAGLDFFPDGRAALCTWDGDVWIVSGLENAGKPGAKLKWKRFAAGLQQPLGLKIIDGYIYTAGRDQITKLHDLNGDGEADFYENFNNDAGLTLQRHEFVMDLQTDRDGNLYYCRSGHYLQSKRGDNCVVYKVSPDGKTLSKFATGFREPNGLSIGPDGVMTVADNEGNGIPQTPIYRLLQGKDYGFRPSTTGKVNDGSWQMLQKPIVWLGSKIDTSAGTQIWVPDDGAAHVSKRWGPLAGKLLHTSYGNCALFHLMIDKSAEPWQGCVWKFPLTFNSGIMRARFNPRDGQLYVCGLRGWGTSAVKDGQLARVRYTGNDLPIPLDYRVTKAGIAFTFSAPLEKKSAEDDDNWAGTWTDAIKKTPGPKDLAEMPITAVRLSEDQRTVTIAVDKLRPVPNFSLQYRIKSAAGAKVEGELHGTIHRVP